ncbi:DUF1638 domain-containing protein [Pararhizobium haloflavum]|uniref:DUF1638 domain-containing protein n=1 Tax=Pararhizobium haloflavum TaxID=2037914 RepID=UPI0027BAE849|nr:DUF1638 domain-containing protein [Pararhizobium haloflavum]
MKTEKVQIIACGALAREIRSVIEANGLLHLAVTCLPAIWHNHPERIVPGVDNAIATARREGFSKIFVAYGDCGTGGALDRLLEHEQVDRLPGPHCYAFFAGTDRFAANAEEDMRAFFLTDFLARQFHAFVVKPLGLDRHPELRGLYFQHYEKLVYLAQSDDDTLDQAAREAATFLDLAYERRFTGYGDLTGSLLATAQI